MSIARLSYNKDKEPQMKETEMPFRPKSTGTRKLREGKGIKVYSFETKKLLGTT